MVVEVKMSGGPLLRAMIISVTFAIAAMALPARGERSDRHLFTEAQARGGAIDYAAYCVTCHGRDLRGPQLPLKGPAFTSLGKDTGMTLGQFFDFVVRDTPAGSLNSLSREQYVEIMAYIMQQNGYAAGTRPLSFARAMHLTTRVGEQPEPLHP
jgi:mono/diheme cytochrome c family protein